MTILRPMQSAALRLVGYKPQVFFASSETFEQEIADLANEVAKDICKYADWQSLTTVYNIPVDGVTLNFPFPSDYDRQLLVTDVQDLNNWVWNYQHIPNINDFLYQKARGLKLLPGVWTIYRGQMQFWPAPTAANTATFPYVSANYATDASTGASRSFFISDTDNFVINGAERLLTLGIIWRWRENKKLDYTGDQEQFNLLIDQLAAKDKGTSTFRRRSSMQGLNTFQAWPYGPLG